MLRTSEAVERRTQLRHQRGEVLLVLRPMRVAQPREARVFPVDIEAIEIVALHEGDGALDEAAPALGRQYGVRKTAGPGPAAHRDEDGELRKAPAQPGQALKVLGIAREAFHDLSVLDVGECVVDVRQLVGSDGGRVDQLVFGEDVADDDARLLCERQPASDQQYHQRNHHRPGSHRSSKHLGSS